VRYITYVHDFMIVGTLNRWNRDIGTKRLASVSGSASSCATPAKPLRRQQRRHRTGRNVQLNIKARAEAVEAFYAITDREKWVLGETFERAIYALKRELAREKSPTV